MPEDPESPAARKGSSAGELPGWNPLRWPTDWWISLSASLIALCALVFTILESRWSRDFQRESVRPRMGVAFWYTEEQAGFRFSNSGLGPGRLDSFSVLVDGKPQPHWRAVFEALGFDSVPDFGFTIPTIGGWHKVGAPLWILSVPPGPAYHRLKAESNRADFVGCYCSMYDECWEFDRSPQKTSVKACDSTLVFSAPPPRAEPPLLESLERFAYVSPTFTTESVRLDLVAGGDYELRDVEARVVDLSRLPEGMQGRRHVVRVIAPDRSSTLGEMPFGSGTILGLNIFFSTPTAAWNQELRLRKIEGKWKVAQRVTIQGSYAILLETSDPRFPMSASGDPEGIATLPTDPHDLRYFGLGGEVKRF